MSKFYLKRSKKAGLPPGSLIHVSNIIPEKVKISLIDYSETFFVEKENVSISESVASLHDQSITWINVEGISDPKIIERIGKEFNLHPLMLEDILNAGQLSKMDDYKNAIYIVMRLLKLNGKNGKTDGKEAHSIKEAHTTTEKEIVDQQISLVLGPNYLISFMETESDIFNGIKNRIRAENSKFRKQGADYLCYSIIDAIVDGYFVILESVDERLEKLEESLVYNPTPRTLINIQKRKRDVLLLRKSIWPMREVLSNLLRTESPFIKDSTKTFFHDVYDHTIQVIDTIESFRDVASGMLEIYLSNMSQRLNEIMKVLTIVSTIFVPLTFLASLYGMNFEYIPGLHTPAGYYIILGLMIAVAVSMTLFFRRKGWI